MSANWTNRTIWCGDNLDIMRGMNSESVDLIATDPPYNSNVDYAAPVGSEAAGAHFKDRWFLNDIKLEWIDMLQANHPLLWGLIQCCQRNSDKAYLVYMIPRLLEMHRLLKPTGSLYLHVDPTMGAYLKLCLDIIFGRANFRNEIAWHYHGGTAPKSAFGRKHDTIYFYGKTRGAWFERQKKPCLNPSAYNKIGADGERYLVDGHGKTYWLKDGKTCDDVWTYVHEPEFNSLSSGSKERTKFKTQKPQALYRRIIAASCPPDGIVFDPFGGCATTSVAAEQLGRQWATCDLSPTTAGLIVTQMEKVGILDFKPRVSEVGPDFALRRTDQGKLPHYRTHKTRLYGEQGGNCNGCGWHFRIGILEVDHIVIRRGMPGADHPDNLQLLCPECNKKKGARGMEYLRQQLKLDAKKFAKV